MFVEFHYNIVYENISFIVVISITIACKATPGVKRGRGNQFTLH